MISVNELLQHKLDPVPKYLLLRDVLKLPNDDLQLVEIKKEVLQTKYVKDIVACQQANGSWGYFHSLSMPNKYPITTEQALRRLRLLGLDFSDLPIKNAVQYMERFLLGEESFTDRIEKLHDWNTFTQLIAAAQIRQFSSSSKPAINIANKWRHIIEYAFLGNEYSQEKYEEAYNTIFSLKPKGGRLIDFINFYPMTLLHGLLTEEIECKLFNYVLNHPRGIYYIYDKCLNTLPASFAAKQTSRYLGAIELLAGYKHDKSQLLFIIEWLMENIGEDRLWDMGSWVKDNVVYPLSNSWRSNLSRKIDCTVRIICLLKKIDCCFV